MIAEHPTLSSYVTGLMSKGQVVFFAEQAEKALGVNRGAFLDAAERLQRKGLLFSPRRSFYVVVPPQYLSWGAPPPAWYIDDLMKHEGHPYYVGLLKAAELHGATHQAVMEFQVVTNKRRPKILAGRSLIGFYYRKDIGEVRLGIEEHKTDTGKMKVSSVELTALDLIRYPHAAGGLDHVVTVIAELAEKIDPKKFASLSPSFERSVGQRLGYLLDRTERAEERNLTRDLFERLANGQSLQWVELDPGEGVEADFAAEPIERDERWHVVVRRLPEADA
jgi:predicted transcriptional regulator of viral defense system